MGGRLFHFSEDPSIERFTPRPVVVPTERPTGQEWLNGPLVWAITEERQAAYLFPRDCPRIILWPIATTSDRDRAEWLGTWSAAAHIEAAWIDRVRATTLYRYELPSETFEGDPWMLISRTEVVPAGVEHLDDLPVALAEIGVDLRVMDDLTPLRDVWGTTLHASGIRLRNATGWAV